MSKDQEHEAARPVRPSCGSRRTRLFRRIFGQSKEPRSAREEREPAGAKFFLSLCLAQ